MVGNELIIEIRLEHGNCLIRYNTPYTTNTIPINNRLRTFGLSPSGRDTHRVGRDVFGREAHWRHLGSVADVLGKLQKSDIVVVGARIILRVNDKLLYADCLL